METAIFMKLFDYCEMPTLTNICRHTAHSLVFEGVQAASEQSRFSVNQLNQEIEAFEKISLTALLEVLHIPSLHRKVKNIIGLRLKKKTFKK